MILFPIILDILESKKSIKTILFKKKKFINSSKSVLQAIEIRENYKDSFIIFSSLAVLSIVMGIPIQLPAFFWFLLRLIYVPLKFFEFNLFQKLTWLLSYLCILWIIILIIFLNRLTMFY